MGQRIWLKCSPAAASSHFVSSPGSAAWESAVRAGELTAMSTGDRT